MTQTKGQIDFEALEKSELYSEALGIDLSAGGEDAYFRWFLASQLYGGRISGAIAENTYRSFERHGLLTPEKIIAAGWDFLVSPVMREGGYVRYDESKSRQFLRNCARLLEEYGGRVYRIEDDATDSTDLEARLCAFHGIGPVTANIFLRELRPFWRKADPTPLTVVAKTAEALGIDLSAYDRKSLTFARVEAGLIRQAHLKH
ncbi:hypothetical protein HPQ64_14995 [Rhizobiales bacterium]|uniref:hypothetical protein n=1 Tax=Hongsoonwoonella zoysiae TaxID=2821844 RepID=UPI001561A1B9|nr:hypothetical protein [Hongsoonwoonella zoysiae]NRG18997.1 hypothetical protein [Hongsoonwoonella zoysiae]